jgi:hypothetical protein
LGGASPCNIAAVLTLPAGISGPPLSPNTPFNIKALGGYLRTDSASSMAQVGTGDG